VFSKIVVGRSKGLR